MERVAEFVIKQRSPLMWSLGGLALAMVALIPLNETNEKFVEQFDHSLQFRQDTDYLLENLTGVYRVDYSLQTNHVSGINDPKFLHDVGVFVEWLRSLPDVRHVASITDTFKRLNKNMHGDDPEWFRLPETRELAGQYLLLYELSLPFGLDLTNRVNIDKSSTRVTVIFKNLRTNYLLTQNQDVMAQWHRISDGSEISSASSTLMFSHIVNRAVHSMVIGTFGVLVFISLLLTILLRSLKMGLVSLLPNLAPMSIALGLWGLFVGEVGMSLSIVLAMTLGIVVDDTVHFLSKYIRARREKGLDAPDSVRYAYRTVGDAMLVTSLVLMAGFLVLSMSLFARNADMGILVSLTIVLALMADLLLLPPLLIKIEAKEKQANFALTPAE
jgi:hypothetical protein